MRNLKKFGYERKKRIYGFLFILPWLIGFSLFFLKPMIQSIAFSFSKVAMTESGFQLDFVKFENFRYIFYESSKFVDNLLGSISAFFYKVPIIFIFSYIIAVSLNGNFKGKTVLRSLYFIPVIISTGVIMQYISGDASMEGMRNSTGSAYLSGLIDFDKVFRDLGIPTAAIDVIMKYVDDIFNLIWDCGIPIVLFISGLQSIPDQLYEVSKVEGATKWEEFWYITTPMMASTINLVLVYTAIDFCSGESNLVMKQAYTLLLGQQNYSQSLAMMWSFFSVVGVIFLIIIFIINRKIFRKWE